jgi:hypothetical protein
MKNKERNIKSIGYVIDNGGEVLDDSKGIEYGEGFDGFFDEGREVSFDAGLQEILEYVREYADEEVVEKDVKEIETKLLELKSEVGDKGIWRVWGVEADWNLGVEL